MKKIITALALAAAFAAPALAQVTAGAPYEPLRAALIAKGWKPDTSYGTRMANGKPLYHQPEVMCGPQLCRAKWRDAQGQAQAIMLDRGVNKDHTVASSQ
jgi:hypothetical protein